MAKPKNPFDDFPPEIKFIYRMSALGFNYRPDDHSWRNERTGALASDEALRDIATMDPLLSNRVLNLFKSGAREINIKVEETDDGLRYCVARVE